MGSDTTINNKQVVELRNWCFNDYFKTLFGDTYGHRKFDDGTYVATSKILDVKQDLAGGYFAVETLNTIYICLFKDVHEGFDMFSVSEIYRKLQEIID